MGISSHADRRPTIEALLAATPVGRIRSALSRTVRSDGETIDALHHEFDRSRRFTHPLTLIAIRPLGAGAAADARMVRDRLRPRLRQLDRSWEDGTRTYLLLPESDRAAAERALDRLTAAEPEILSSVRIGIASFPQDAMTAQALVDAAGAGCDPESPSDQVQDPSARSGVA